MSPRNTGSRKRARASPSAVRSTPGPGPNTLRARRRLPAATVSRATVSASGPAFVPPNSAGLLHAEQAGGLRALARLRGDVGRDGRVDVLGQLGFEGV